MNQNELVLRINPETTGITVEKLESGIISRRVIDADNLYKCIQNSYSMKFSTGLLPNHCLSVSRYHNQNLSYVLWFPCLYADIQYYNTQYHHFPIPRLLFGIKLTPEGRPIQCNIGVIQDETPKPETKLYHYPFSNVSGFSLCTGGNVLPLCKTAPQIENFPRFLLSIPNNDDQYSKENNKLHMPHRELLNHLKDQEPEYYYSHVLVPNGKILEDFIEFC